VVRIDHQRCAMRDPEDQCIELARDEVGSKCTGDSGIGYRDAEEWVTTRLAEYDSRKRNQHHIRRVCSMMRE